MAYKQISFDLTIPDPLIYDVEAVFY